uniref:ribosomal protein L20 n=1 Tax=Prototheca cerasi TaxID=2509258 RepID=UPI003003071A
MKNTKYNKSKKFLYKKRINILKKTKGFRGTRGINFKISNQSYIKSLTFKYRDRKNKKRFFKKLWVSRINSKLYFFFNWSKLHHLYRTKNILFNKKIINFMLTQDEFVFYKIFLNLL